MGGTPVGATGPRRRFYRHLYFWVLVAIALGVLVGIGFPRQAAQMKWLADLFVNLVKIVIAPTIFCTVVVGIAGLGNLARAGGLALRTIGYFTVMTTLALAIGLVVVNVLRPGEGLGIAVNEKAAAETIKKAGEAEAGGITGFVLSLVPKSFLGAFTDNQLIQVLVLAVLVAVAVSGMGERGRRVVEALDTTAKVMFGVIKVVMYAAPVGAFGGMAFTVGKYGNEVLTKLAYLMGAFYLTCLIFVFVVLGVVCRLVGFSVVRFVRFLKDELLIVLGTSSSESVLPRVLVKLEAAGAQKSVVGLTIPTGYSFNLDGTCIYLTMGAIFIAQATGHEVGLGTQLGLLLFMLLSSKGAAGVTGAGLVTLAASLQAFGDTIPVVGIALIIGIDRFMSEARALTNLVGNGVATMVVARWQGALDLDRLRAVLERPELVDVDALLKAEERAGRADQESGTGPEGGSGSEGGSGPAGRAAEPVPAR
ncbi:aerobic C4-dicarboxylate transport protein [Streptoalloteichus tenebrarius]|uniref:Aerobic C4-dicarboxylate transport protein n=1 Tax=Streptoalloteichus tenebrarius (strain ATCC 17920 / DSM 40477 / JCM 4838 / CBS 697.72 / NBRC 16177 / NCIMB 11028 / NRRL B-12390 / A12253. 1 / ISP 5477) TaxID=1933 RepID=A0ABT1HNE9_STRSD|nr:C4-dicarboxylate transporter DctA [Streptoalloteichus tenebrarius]MCP2257035.1 aerobic C4-dicarboxylate transport protein [Streptoalloteichus tenebrarius]BFF00055.1 dicarboxylate/amino acid:cation symporter [Streptoalloteichus tenebrarius]